MSRRSPEQLMEEMSRLASLEAVRKREQVPTPVASLDIIRKREPPSPSTFESLWRKAIEKEPVFFGEILRGSVEVTRALWSLKDLFTEYAKRNHLDLSQENEEWEEMKQFFLKTLKERELLCGINDDEAANKMIDQINFAISTEVARDVQQFPEAYKEEPNHLKKSIISLDLGALASFRSRFVSEADFKQRAPDIAFDRPFWEACLEQLDRAADGMEIIAHQIDVSVRTTESDPFRSYPSVDALLKRGIKETINSPDPRYAKEYATQMAIWITLRARTAEEVVQKEKRNPS